MMNVYEVSQEIEVIEYEKEGKAIVYKYEEDDRYLPAKNY